MVLFRTPPIHSSSLMSGKLNQPSPKQIAGVTSQVSPWLATAAYPLASNVVIPGYFGRIDIYGQDNLPKQGPVILAPTHRSRWDALLIPYATGRYVTGRDLRFMVSANEMTGIQGWFVRRLGGFPVNTHQPAIASLRFGVEALQDQEMMVIFPEGGIFRDNKLHPLKPGLARLALQAELSKPELGVQIVPIYIRYEEAYPRWRCPVTMRIGHPIQVKHYCNENCRDVSKQAARQLTTDLELSLQTLGATPFKTPNMAERY